MRLHEEKIRLYARFSAIIDELLTAKSQVDFREQMASPYKNVDSSQVPANERPRAARLAGEAAEAHARLGLLQQELVDLLQRTAIIAPSDVVKAADAAVAPLLAYDKPLLRKRTKELIEKFRSDVQK
ncbi:hypothetical protein [Micromonospora saelicesensis]|uniref:hypothetical protein n=1 Tax=Micromonospora saelicesensis TaxID=285676 RepID=UPI0011BEA651|nr:hypothetical protein [Micromonospora saelicesensis]